MRSRLLLSVSILGGMVCLQEPAVTGEMHVSEHQVRDAVQRSLIWLERSAHRSLTERRQCFTCHNQGLPMMVLASADRRGFLIDEAELQRQTQATATFLTRNIDGYRAGKGQAGQVFMAGYALWALDYVDWPADDTTAAVAEYFLQSHADTDHWTTKTQRPPSEGSPFAATFLGLMSLDRYGTPEQQPRIAERRQRVLNWLLKSASIETEDRVFRLWGLHAASASAAEIKRAAGDLLDLQQHHGGWAQAESMAADAYATGTALVALHQAGGIATVDLRYQRGMRYLLDTQAQDGTWHVASRSVPFQAYYESGYPYGDDQFISMSAASWATLALTLSLPELEPASSSRWDNHVRCP